MAQVKKGEVREAILAAAFTLFADKGYHATTMAQIAERAQVSTANLYVYYQSKISVLYALYEPWFTARLDALAEEIRAIRGPRKRLHRLVQALWSEIPAEHNGFVSNFIQAISTIDASEDYQPSLLASSKQKLIAVLDEILPAAEFDATNKARLAHLLLMAFDGFAIGRRLDPRSDAAADTAKMMTSLLFSKKSNGSSQARSSATRRLRDLPEARSVSEDPR